MCDNQAVQLQILKNSGYRIGRSFLAQEWERSAGKRFITHFEIQFYRLELHFCF